MKYFKLNFERYFVAVGTCDEYFIGVELYKRTLRMEGYQKIHIGKECVKNIPEDVLKDMKEKIENPFFEIDLRKEMLSWEKTNSAFNSRNFKWL